MTEQKCVDEAVVTIGFLTFFVLLIIIIVMSTKNEVKNKPRFTSRLRLSRQVEHIPAVVPIWWDDSEGAYMIKLHVGKGLIECVIDTGSNQLSAKGSECQWTNCDEGSCSTQTCPCGLDEMGRRRKDCSNLMYRPTGEHMGTGGKLTYGSQEDTVQHWNDDVNIPCMQLSCDNLLSTVGELGMKTDTYQSIENIMVHLVTHIRGTSASNLFGLAMPTDDSSLVAKLFPNKKPCWSIVLRNGGGWWAMGALPCFSKVEYAPLVDPPAFRSFVTQFYVVPLTSMWVGSNAGDMVQVKKGVPKYCIIDTGTTLTYGSTTLGKGLSEKGWSETLSFIKLVLGSVEITWSPKQLADPDYQDSSIIQVTKGRTLDDFDTIFPSGALLLGVLMMRNCYWEFDCVNHRLGIQALS